MSGHFWIASVIGGINTLVCLCALGVGAAMIFGHDRRAGALLWIAAGLFLTRSIAAIVLNALVLARLGPEQGLTIVWGVDGALSITAWLLIAGALVLVARTLREPRRTGLPPAPTASQTRPGISE